MKLIKLMHLHSPGFCVKMRRIVAPPSTHAVDTRGAFNPCELFSFAEGGMWPCYAAVRTPCQKKRGNFRIHA